MALFPIKASEQQLFRMYKQSVAVFWTPEEIDFSKDIVDWEKLTADELLRFIGGLYRVSADGKIASVAGTGKKGQSDGPARASAMNGPSRSFPEKPSFMMYQPRSVMSRPIHD